MVEGKIGKRVSYEDMRNPKLIGTIVGKVGEEWGVEWEDGEETVSDLRQAGWREETPGVAHVERLHLVQPQPVSTPPMRVELARQALETIFTLIGRKALFGRVATFQDIDEPLHPHGISFHVPGVASPEEMAEVLQVCDAVIDIDELGMAPKLRWAPVEDGMRVHLFFLPDATRYDYLARFTHLADAVHFETTALSIGSEFLPEAARAVRDGRPPTVDYWRWLLKQIEGP